jgi:pimeloyl-ACP methyl ester carboxylesterase
VLAFERHGSGEPLVLVHGISHRRQVWYPVLDQLAEQREVILVDLPGHGQSPPFVPGTRPVVEALRAEFRQFLAEQELDRPHIAGNSLGGRVALEAGAAGDARSVTALSPAGFWRRDASFAYTRRLFISAAKLSERIGPRAAVLANTRVGRTVLYGLLTSHPARITSEHALGDVVAFEYARPAMHLLLGAASQFQHVIDSSVPVTIAWAGRDLVLPPWQANVAKKALPNAIHVGMRGVGHVPMFDDPGLVAEVLLQGSAPLAGVAKLSPASARKATKRPTAESASA